MTSTVAPGVGRVDRLPSPSGGARAGGVVALLAVLLGGCGLRFETTAPETPMPNQLEVIRQRAATDAAAISVLAEQAVAETTAAPAGPDATEPTPDPTEPAPDPTLAVLQQIVAASDAHLAALGGVYEPFPEDTAAPPDDETTAPGGAVVGLLELLTETGSRARRNADQVDDGPMAALLASIAASRLVLAESLAAAAGLEPPEVVAPTVPEVVPRGVAGADLLVLTQSEDALGLAWEVHAARTRSAERREAALRAAAHRARAQAWAETTDVVGSGMDPRRTSYDLPDALVEPDATAEQAQAVLGELEARLLTSYASLVAAADPGQRAAFILGLWDSVRTLATLGEVDPLPGLA